MNWIFHNLFLRLRLVFGGVIGISTSSTCPCCGQVASSYPTGLSIIVILGAILAGLGVCYKKISGFFEKLFRRKPAETPLPGKRSKQGLFGWGLFLLTLTAIIVIGNYFPAKPARENT